VTLKAKINNISIKLLYALNCKLESRPSPILASSTNPIINTLRDTIITDKTSTLINEDIYIILIGLHIKYTATKIININPTNKLTKDNDKKHTLIKPNPNINIINNL